MTKIMYKCGHETESIILDSNPLSLSKYFEWYDTVGLEGNRTKCWNCFLKKDKLHDYCKCGNIKHERSRRCKVCFSMNNRRQISRLGKWERKRKKLQKQS